MIRVQSFIHHKTSGGVEEGAVCSALIENWSRTIPFSGVSTDSFGKALHPLGNVYLISFETYLGP